MNFTSMNYTIDWVGEKIFWIQGVISLVFYGFYVALFLFSLYTLSRRRTTGTTLLIFANYLMAVAGTTQIALTITVSLNDLDTLQGIIEGNEGKIASAIHAGQELYIAQAVTFVANKWIAFSFSFYPTTDKCQILTLSQLYRCYVIWSCQMKPIILPALLLVLTAGIGGYASTPKRTIVYERAAYTLAAATSLSLTALTAGRIFWVRRAASTIFCPDSPISRRYKMAVGVILESGAVYLLGIMALVIGSFSNVDMTIITLGIAQQLMAGSTGRLLL
ncbi:hypothetical protein R3P38DRAFT_3190120 [Favolaschia claudopus]|uniref:Uncharacterized protein n=1 Tax=Favolaschia claudopus TaxID=2862362 RepID=A0AAW0BQ08_9AGAR